MVAIARPVNTSGILNAQAVQKLKAKFGGQAMFLSISARSTIALEKGMGLNLGVSFSICLGNLWDILSLEGK